MIGRMTVSQTNRDFLADLGTNSRRLDEAQRQVSTGKRISSPADDPLGISQALRLRQDQASTAAWSSNIDDSQTWLSTTDTALDNATQVLQRARELAVQGANGALSTSARATLANEVQGLLGQMVEIGNTAVGGRSIFGGTKTQSPAFSSTGTFQGNTGAITRETGPSQVIQVNVTGQQLMGPGGSVSDVFTTLSQLASDLSSSNQAGIQGSLSTLDAHITNVNAIRGQVGARVNQLELSKSRFETQGIATSDQLSSIEDVDMAQAITDLKTREDLYRASLGVGGRVLQPSLLDFLR